MTLLGVTAILGGGLYVLFNYGPRQQPSVAEPSELALSYLEKEVAANPRNFADRLKLARMQLTIGRADDAAATLAPLLDTRSKEGRAARALMFDVEFRRVGDTPADDPGRPARLAAARAALSRILEVDGQSLTEADWEERAKQRLALDEPAAAATAYEIMAQRFQPNRVKWLEEAARWHEATGNLNRSADQLLQASREAADPGKATDLALLALKKRQAAGEPAIPRAQAEAKALRVRFPQNGKVKDETQALVDELNYEESKPHGDDAKLRDLLGNGRIKSALVLLKKMVQDRPKDPERLRWLALVARWNEEPELSLDTWYALAQLGKPEGIAEGLPVARALYDNEKVAGLLELKGKAGPLSPEEVYELAERRETLGEPEAALAALETFGRGLRKDPRYYRTRMVLHQACNRPDDAFGEILAMQAATGLSIEDVVMGMEMLWKNDQPGRALDFGRSQRPLAGPSDHAFWKLLGDLAFAESAFTESQEAYAMVARAPSANPQRGVFERLLHFAGNKGNVDEFTEFAMLGYARHHEPDWIMQAMDLAYGKERWDKLKILVELAKKEETKFQSKAMFWRVRGATIDVREQDALAEEYLQRSLGAGDHQDEVRLELLRLSVSQKNKVVAKERLDAYGAGMASNPAAFDILHEAYELLGDAEKSEFFRRKARNHELSVDEASLSRPANTRTRKDGTLLPAAVRMEMAGEDKDRAAMKAILDEPGDDLPAAARIEAEHELGRDERAVLPLRSLEAQAKQGGPESEAATLLATELAATYHDVVDTRGGGVGASGGITELGDLRLEEATAHASLPWAGLPGQVGVHAGITRLRPKDELALQVENTSEYFFGGTFRRDVSWGATDLMLGVLALEDGTTPTARVAQSFRPGRRTAVSIAGFYHQASLHSSLLRASGFENGAALGFHHAFLANNRVEASVEGLRFATHDDNLIAWGMMGRFVDAQEFDLGKLHLSLEATGEFLVTRRAKAVPEGLPIPNDEFDTVLPDQYFMGGVGAVLSSEGHAVGSGVGRPYSLHYSAEGQGGLLWPGTRPWGGAAAGAGLVFPRFQELFLRGHYYSSYGGLAGQRYAGITLGYVIRWL